MHTTTTTLDKLYKKKLLLSYITSQEKYGLVGSFVVDNYWETFNQEKHDAIAKFRQIAKDSIHSFIEAYEDVWDFVVTINRLDDVFVCERTEKDKVFRGLSYEELKVANKLLSLSLYSELEKDCLMALNKSILGELADDLSKKYGFTDEQFQLLMTPSFETFFTKYHFAHLEYAVTTDAKLKEQRRATLINDFHAKDSALFELRFADMYFPEDNREEMLSAHRQALAKRSAAKNALIADKDELVSFERLLQYDNFLDFEFRYNLQACPEYYLRKILFKACQESGIFTDHTKPLALKDAEFIDGVNALISLRADKYVIETAPDFNIDAIDDIKSIKKLPVQESTQEEILHRLRQGRPCLALQADKNAHIVIVGYDDGALLAVDADKKQIILQKSDLENLTEVFALHQQTEVAIETFDNDIKKLVDRPPYLNRTDYEHGF